MVPPQRRSGPAPRKSLGQHFLRDSGVLHDIARAVRVPPGGVVVEIGAGTGQLTEALLDAGHDVVALEIEDRLVGFLRQRFSGTLRLRVVRGDARDLELSALVAPGVPFAVAGNLPYFAASPIIRRLLESDRKASDIVVMVQREVAREIAARPGAFSLLTISVQVYAEAEVLFDVAPEAFDPPPNVWSSVVRLTPRDESLVPAPDIEAFFDLVRKTFRNPRKQIHNCLTREAGLRPEQAQQSLAVAGIDPMRRPETLSIGEWLALLAATRRVRADG